MKIEHLKEFVILAQFLNFGKAADYLYITQPVLSRHIMGMEEELGTDLFHRYKSGLKLTEAGVVFLEETKQIVKRYDIAISKVYKGVIREKLGVGLLYYSKELLIPTINRFQTDFPNVDIRFLSKTPNELVQALFNEEIDIAHLHEVDFDGSENLNKKSISEEPLILMVHRKHRFKDIKKVSISELETENFLNIDDVFYKGYYKYVRNLLYKKGVVIEENPFLVKDYESLLLEVQSGRGVALLSSNMRKQANPFSIYIDLEEKDITIKRGLFYKKDNNNPVISKFLSRFNRVDLEK